MTQEEFEEIYGHEDMPLPPVRTITTSDRLTPRPPRGWLRVYTYAGLSDGWSLVFMGCWIYLLGTIQAHGKDAGEKLHHIARDSYGNRVLCCHPDLYVPVGVEVCDLATCIEDTGGHETIEAQLQDNAIPVLTKRIWRKLPLHERAEMVEHAGDEADPAGLLGDDVPNSRPARGFYYDISELERILLWET